MKTQIAWAMFNKAEQDIPTEEESSERFSTFSICKTRKSIRELVAVQDNPKEWKVIKVAIREV